MASLITSLNDLTRYWGRKAKKVMPLGADVKSSGVPTEK